MRIKIIGDNNCARATRHLLRMGGFAVTEFLPAEAITEAPHHGYAITIELAPAPHPLNPSSTPGSSTHGPTASGNEEASAFAEASADVSSPTLADGANLNFARARHAVPLQPHAVPPAAIGISAIHFDSVDGALEAAVLRHVAKLAAAPVLVDRPGGVVHSERELRIVVPCTGDAKADEAAAVAVEFGVLRGLLDLASSSPTILTGKSAEASGALPSDSPTVSNSKKWWRFGMAFFAGAAFMLSGNLYASPAGPAGGLRRVVEERGVDGAYLHLEAALSPAAAQGQFADGQMNIALIGGAAVSGSLYDSSNTALKVNCVVGCAAASDPCKIQAKSYVSINQTGNTQLAAGTSAKKIYICSVHVVVAAATNVALVEGTGTTCGTGTAGVNGFGGATAATGWNFMANGGIALGNGDSSLGAEGTAADNLCLYNSGSGQVSGGISYVVQ